MDILNEEGDYVFPTLKMQKDIFYTWSCPPEVFALWGKSVGVWKLQEV